MRISLTGGAVVLLTLTLAPSACDGGEHDAAAPPPPHEASGSTRQGSAQTECPEDPDWQCGTIAVPVDRASPDGEQLQLSFAVHRHTDDGSTAADAVFATDGGPGIANFANRDFLTYINQGLMDERDLVLVDHRGTGRSGALDCPGLQSVIGNLEVDPEALLHAIGDCGRQLGLDADRYGSGDIAMDMEDVRAFLGYDAIDLYGMSYGGTVMSAYATRYPERVRALVIDAGVPATDPRHSWTWGMDLPKRLAEVVAHDCASFDPCSSTTPSADTALSRLAAHVRRHPVAGVIDPDGAGPERVVVDERQLAALAWSEPDPYLFATAADALDKGDPKPLLDIAERAGEDPWTPAQPELDSAADNAAVFCNDQDFVWDRTDSFSLRGQKYDQALRSSDPNLFAPFSAAAWTTVYAADYCRYWPAPDRFIPAVEPGATATTMPVLILSGDLDTSVPTRTTRELLRIFPAAAFVEVPDAVHPVSASSPCGQAAMQEFVRSLEPPAADACG